MIYLNDWSSFVSCQNDRCSVIISEGHGDGARRAGMDLSFVTGVRQVGNVNLSRCSGAYAGVITSHR